LVVVWCELSLFSWDTYFAVYGICRGDQFQSASFSFNCGENVPITPGIYPEGLNKQQDLLESMPS